MLSCVVATIQNSARAQQRNSVTTCKAGHDAFPSTTPSDSFHRRSSRAHILIANPRLELELSNNDPNHLQISNREQMAVCRLARLSRQRLFRLSPANPHLSLLRGLQANRGLPTIVFLMVTPRLEFPATLTKQDSTQFLIVTKRRFRRSTVASTSRKAIMSRNHFIRIPRFRPLMRKVTNADPNQS
jgi:hypothetical protein